MAQFILAFDGGSPTLLPVARITQIYIKAMGYDKETGKLLFAIMVVSLDENNQGMYNMVSTHDTEQGARRYMSELLCILNDGCDPAFCVVSDVHDMPHNP